MRNRLVCTLSTGALVALLGGCTQQELDANVQTAAVVSCVLADGSQVEYAIASAIIVSEGSNAGKTGQKVLNTSSLVATGSRTLCISLSTLNTQLQTPTMK